MGIEANSLVCSPPSWSAVNCRDPIENLFIDNGGDGAIKMENGQSDACNTNINET